jgi:hypothetical protein
MKVVPYILLAICVFLLFAFWWNRGSPKIIETIIVVIVVMISALFYVAQPEKIDKKINILYLENQKKNELFFPSKGRFGVYYHHQEMFYRAYSKKPETIEYKSKLKPYDVKIVDRELTDLQAIAVIDYMAMWLRRSWYTDKETVLTPPFSEEAGGGRLGEEDLLKDVVEYDDAALKEIGLKANMFWDGKFEEFHLTLPKNTTIKYTVDYRKAISAELVLQKSAFFKIRFQILRRGGAMGLGDIGYYLGITDLSEEQSADNPNISNYFHHRVQIRCSAEFNRFSVGHPKMAVYKEWTKRLFEELYKRFEWDICYEGLKDRQIFLSGAKMLREDGRGGD